MNYHPSGFTLYDSNTLEALYHSDDGFEPSLCNDLVIYSKKIDDKNPKVVLNIVDLLYADKSTSIKYSILNDTLKTKSVIAKYNETFDKFLCIFAAKEGSLTVPIGVLE